MKITKSQLKEIIDNCVKQVLKEQSGPVPLDRSGLYKIDTELNTGDKITVFLGKDGRKSITRRIKEYRKRPAVKYQDKMYPIQSATTKFSVYPMEPSANVKYFYIKV